MESEKRAVCSYFSDLASVPAKYILETTEAEVMKYFMALLDDRNKDDIVTIADYGTGDAGNATPFINKLIDLIQKTSGSQQQICIYFIDQYWNDFNALFHNITGNHRVEALRISDNVHSFASASSMFEQCLPSSSLDFGCSLFAVFYLSHWSAKIKNGIYSIDADPDQLSIIKRQARQDWRNFVYNRGKELKPGGFCYVSTIVKGGEAYFRYLTDVYREMVDEGHVTKEEFENTNIECYYERTEEDLRLPFTDESDVEIKSLGLKLLKCSIKEREFFPLPSSYSGEQATNEEFEKSRAAEISNLVKGFLYNSLYGGLSAGRGDVERAVIIDSYFESLRRNLLKDKTKFPQSLPLADIYFQKKF